MNFGVGKVIDDIVEVNLSQAVTDLRIGQIGHSLGPRATLSYYDSILTKNLLNCSVA